MYGDMKEDFEIEDSQKVCCHMEGMSVFVTLCITYEQDVFRNIKKYA